MGAFIGGDEKEHFVLLANNPLKLSCAFFFLCRLLFLLLLAALKRQGGVGGGLSTCFAQGPHLILKMNRRQGDGHGGHAGAPARPTTRHGADQG